MVQVTGPLDNEYFYVDFRDYEYDLKWEFPRENLEFGKDQLFRGSLAFPFPCKTFNIRLLHLCREGPGVWRLRESDECHSLWD